MFPLPLGARECLAHLFEACRKLGRKILLLPFYYHLTNIFKKQDLQQLDNWTSVLYCVVSAFHRAMIFFSTPCQHRSCHTLSEMKAPGDAWAGFGGFSGTATSGQCVICERWCRRVRGRLSLGCRLSHALDRAAGYLVHLSASVDSRSAHFSQCWTLEFN